MSQYGPLDVGAQKLTSHFPGRKGLDLNAPLGGDLPNPVPPLTDSGASDSKGAGEVASAPKTPDGNDDSGIDCSVHKSDDKAILSERQVLLTSEDEGETPADMGASSKTSSDSVLLAERLRAAFAACGTHAVDVKNAISRELGISRQAIDGWLRTGRIGKTRLVVVARHTGQSLDYFLGQADMTAQEEDEVSLVLHYRNLPDVLKANLVADAKAYAELVPPKPKSKK